MTGKESYKRAIEFKGPAYLPCTIGVNLEWLYDKDESKRERVRELSARCPNDMLGWISPADFGVDQETRDGVRRWQDQWGTGWEDDGHGAKTEAYPLEGGYEALAAYAFPDPKRAGRFDAESRWTGYEAGKPNPPSGVTFCRGAVPGPDGLLRIGA